MTEYAIAESDLWLVLEIPDDRPAADEDHLRIRQAIACGRRASLTGGPIRWIALGDDDATTLRAHLPRARHRFRPAEQRAIDRILDQLKAGFNRSFGTDGRSTRNAAQLVGHRL
jgi:hypothetical protein